MFLALCYIAIAVGLVGLFITYLVTDNGGYCFIVGGACMCLTYVICVFFVNVGLAGGLDSLETKYATCLTLTSDVIELKDAETTEMGYKKYLLYSALDEFYSQLDIMQGLEETHISVLGVDKSIFSRVSEIAEVGVPIGSDG